MKWDKYKGWGNKNFLKSSENSQVILSFKVLTGPLVISKDGCYLVIDLCV